MQDVAVIPEIPPKTKGLIASQTPPLYLGGLYLV